MGSKKKKDEDVVRDGQENEILQEQDDCCAASPEETEMAGQQGETLQKETEHLKEQLMRTLAEYDNFRKRSAKEKETLFADGKAYAAEALLTVVDNFERALNTESSDEGFKKGMEMIFKQMLESLEKIGVCEIEAAGKPFDPLYHNAVMHVEDEELSENMIKEVFQKGYQLGDKVIRHAMVQVAN